MKHTVRKFPVETFNLLFDSRRREFVRLRFLSHERQVQWLRAGLDLVEARDLELLEALDLERLDLERLGEERGLEVSERLTVSLNSRCWTQFGVRLMLSIFFLFSARGTDFSSSRSHSGSWLVRLI